MKSKSVYPRALLILGAGGHGRVIADVFSRAHPDSHIAFLDDLLSGTTVNGHQIVGRLADWPIAVEQLGRRGSGPVDLIVGIGDNRVRKRWASKIGTVLSSVHGEVQWKTLIDPSSVVSETAEIGEGTFLVPQSVINANASIGRHVIINTSVSIGHDCKLADYVHVAPGARLAGAVEVGEGAHIGVGASVIPGIRIGAWSVVGAGSVVVKDIPDGVVAYGVPARVQRDVESKERTSLD